MIIPGGSPKTHHTPEDARTVHLESKQAYWEWYWYFLLNGDGSGMIALSTTLLDMTVALWSWMSFIILHLLIKYLNSCIIRKHQCETGELSSEDCKAIKSPKRRKAKQKHQEKPLQQSNSREVQWDGVCDSLKDSTPTEEPWMFNTPWEYYRNHHLHVISADGEVSPQLTCGQLIILWIWISRIRRCIVYRCWCLTIIFWGDPDVYSLHL